MNTRLGSASWAPSVPGLGVGHSSEQGTTTIRQEAGSRVGVSNGSVCKNHLGNCVKSVGFWDPLAGILYQLMLNRC